MEKYAKEDTRLLRGQLNENIEVAKTGRYYPAEYSTAINAYQQSSSMLAEIPKSLAGIVEHYNDFKINSWSNDQELEIGAERNQIELDDKDRERELHLETSNRVYDRTLEYQDKVSQAKKLAEQSEDGPTVEQAVAEVAEEYRQQDDFSSPMARSMWADSFQRITEQELRLARTNDRNREEYLAGYNMQQIILSSLPEVTQGRMSPSDAFNKAVPELIPFLQDLPIEKQKDQIDSLWSAVNIERARYIADRVARGLLSAEEGMTELRALLDESVKSTFTAKNNKGEDILDAKGKPVQLTATLTFDAQAALYQTLRDLKSSSAADDILLAQKEEFDVALGRSEFDSTGFSTKVLAYESIDALDNWTDGQLISVANSKASDKTKLDTATHMIQTYARARASLAVGTLAKLSKENTAQLVIDFYNKLEQDIKNPNTNWNNYTLKKTINGEPFELIAPGILTSNPILGNTADATRNYYIGMLPALEKMKDKLENGSLNDLLPYIDREYSNTMDQISNNISASTLLLGTAQNGYSTNDTAVMQVVDLLENLENIANKYGAGNEELYGGILEDMVNRIHDPSKGFKTGYETLVGAQAITKVFKQAGRALDLAEYARTHSGQGQSGGMFMTMLALSDMDKKLSEQINTAMKLKITDPSSINRESSKIRDTRNELLKEMHVPPAHELWWKNLSEACMDAAYLSPDLIKQDVYERLFESAIKASYIDLGRGYKMQSALFKYSPQMKMYSGEGGVKRLQNDLRAYNDKFVTVAKKLKIPKSDYSKWTWYSDDANKCLRLTHEGLGFEQIGENHKYVGVFYNNEEIADIDPNIRATMAAVGFGVTLLSERGAIQENIMQTKVPLTRDQIDTEEVSANALGIYSLAELYNNDKTKLRQDALQLARILNDPNKFNTLCKESQMYLDNKDALKTFSTTNPLLNYMFVNSGGFPKTRKSPIIEMLREEGITGFAAPIDYASIIQAEESHVGKIKQSNVSVPISFAGVGEEDYIDLYNVANAGGYKIDDAYIPGVTMTSGYDGPTGFAAPMMSRTVPPKATKVRRTPEEILQLIDSAADTWGIDRKLAHALVGQESRGDQYAKSHAGAVGLGQLMPATAKELGVTDRTDAAQNIWGSMKYLNQMLKRFGGDVPLALAAYNAGPGAVAKARGIPNNKETQNYVKKICGKIGIDPTDKSYPVDMSIKTNEVKFLDPDTGMLSSKGMNDFMYLINHSNAYKNKVLRISTNRKELLEDKPEYADFKKYRKLKNSEGKPLFVSGEYDGFKIHVKKDPSISINATAIPALADNAAATQTQAIPQVERDSVEALLSVLSTRTLGDVINKGTFGVANLTGDEYEEYGVPASVLKNPVMQARVATQEFQRAKDILGSERKAIFALVGGKLRDEHGHIKSWSEVKQDRENFMKRWFIQPSSEAKTRDEINALVAMYEAEYKRIRGV